MAIKHIPEEPKKPSVEEIKTSDLVYSLEVKLIDTDKGWFMIEGAASPNMKYNDPAGGITFDAITSAVERRIPEMSAEDLENLKAHLSSGPFRIIKEFRDVKELTLAQNYQNYKPEVLKQQKEKVENIIKMEKQIEELRELIQKKLQEKRSPDEIQKSTRNSVKKTTDS